MRDNTIINEVCVKDCPFFGKDCTTCIAWTKIKAQPTKCSSSPNCYVKKLIKQNTHKDTCLIEIQELVNKLKELNDESK